MHSPGKNQLVVKCKMINDKTIQVMLYKWSKLYLGTYIQLIRQRPYICKDKCMEVLKEIHGRDVAIIL